MGVTVAPPLGGSDSSLLGVCQKGGFGDVPFVGSKQKDVRTRAVHLVGLAGMDGLLLDSIDLQRIQLLIKYLQ